MFSSTLLNKWTIPDSSNREKGQKFPADVAWAAAMAADRINQGKYLTVPDRDEKGELLFDANKNIIRNLLNNPADILDVDYQQGREFRLKAQGNIMKVLAGTANDYVKKASSVASDDDIYEIDIGLLASLPRSIRRDGKFEEVKSITNRLAAAGHIGRVGETVTGTIKVIQSFFSNRWNSFCVKAEIDGRLIWYFSNTGLSEGVEYKMRGKVKRHCDDGATQLNYVKILRD
jgi:hypothetical protein